MDTRLRVAVAGLGRWGPKQLAAFARLPEALVTAVADPDPVRRASHAAPGITPVPSLAALLDRDDVEAIVLTTPSALHAAQAEQVLRSGRHVLIEKPLALRLDEADRVTELAARQPGIAMMGHLLEHHVGFAALARELTRGTIGELRGIRARRFATRETPQDPWWNLAPHDIGLCLRFAGTPRSSRTTRRTAAARSVELQFAGDVAARIEVAYGAPRQLRELRLFGTIGTAVLDDTPDGARLWFEPCHRSAADMTARSLTKLEPTWLAFDGERRPLDLQAAAFVRAVRERHVSVGCDLTTGREVVRCLAAADRPGDEQRAAPVQ